MESIINIFKSVKRRKWPISRLEKECLAEKWDIHFANKAINGLDFTIACRQLCREQGFESSLVLCMLQNRTLHIMLSCKGYFLDSLKNDIDSNLKYLVVATSGLKPADGWTINRRMA